MTKKEKGVRVIEKENQFLPSACLCLDPKLSRQCRWRGSVFRNARKRITRNGNHGLHLCAHPQHCLGEYVAKNMYYAPGGGGFIA